MAGTGFSVSSVLTDWTPDPLLVVGLAAAVAAYAAGVRRLARRGDRWPVGRSVAFALGVATVVVATMSGLGTYDTTVFSAHMVQHMLLLTIAPVPLALSAPTTLALRTLPPRPRHLLLALLHSRLSRVVTHPATAFCLYVGSTFALYFSGIYPYTLEHAWAHELLHVHFLLSGCLFAWVVAGIDPIPHRLGYGGRMLLTTAALPFHAFLGVALLTQTTVIAAAHYRAVGSVAGDLLADQRTGAGIMWSSGEFVGLLLLFAVLAQWSRSEERVAARTDRQLDRLEAAERARLERRDAERDAADEAALAAYNARLARLAAQSGAPRQG